MAATRSRNSTIVPFMFSYNCLSWSSWPAVPSPCCKRGDDLVEPVGHRVQPVVQLLIGRQFAERAFPAIDPAGDRVEVGGRPTSAMWPAHRRSAASRGSPPLLGCGRSRACRFSSDPSSERAAAGLFASRPSVPRPWLMLFATCLGRRHEAVSSRYSASSVNSRPSVPVRRGCPGQQRGRFLDAGSRLFGDARQRCRRRGRDGT